MEATARDGSRPISRVLSWTAIPLGRRSPAASCGLPAGFGGPPTSIKTRLPIWPCSGWGLPAGAVTGPAVRSYRTISPLPVPAPQQRGPATERWQRAGHRRYVSVALSVAFAGRLPAYSAQVLPGTLPCGARTFLYTQGAAAVWPAPVSNMGPAANRRKRRSSECQAATRIASGSSTAEHVLEHQA